MAAKFMESMTADFAAADANSDGLLDADEFRAFQAAQNEAAKKRDDWIDES